MKYTNKENKIRNKNNFSLYKLFQFGLYGFNIN